MLFEIVLWGVWGVGMGEEPKAGLAEEGRAAFEEGGASCEWRCPLNWPPKLEALPGAHGGVGYDLYWEWVDVLEE